MIISLLKLSPIPEKRQAILDVLRFVEDKVRLKRGCLGCGIYEECDKGRSILYLEQWRSKEENHLHIQSKLYLRLLNAMDLGRKAPEIVFLEVSDTKGIDLIEALRGARDAGLEIQSPPTNFLRSNGPIPVVNKEKK